MADIAVTGTEFADRAELSAGETEGIVREDDFSGTVPVFILDVVNEGFDVDCGGTALLAGCVIAFETAVCLTDGFLDGHERDITFPVATFGAAIAMRCSVIFFGVFFSDFCVSESGLGEFCGHWGHDFFVF